ncbi:MAG: hypothetical protein WKG52_16755 [Variovorax sp.]
MSGAGRLALTVTELEAGEYHYTLMEAATAPGELLSFRPLNISNTAHATAMKAWFAGLGAVRKIEASGG